LSCKTSSPDAIENATTLSTRRWPAAAFQRTTRRKQVTITCHANRTHLFLLRLLHYSADLSGTSLPVQRLFAISHAYIECVTPATGTAVRQSVTALNAAPPSPSSSSSCSRKSAAAAVAAVPLIGNTPSTTTAPPAMRTRPRPRRRTITLGHYCVKMSLCRPEFWNIVYHPKSWFTVHTG